MNQELMSLANTFAGHCITGIVALVGILGTISVAWLNNQQALKRNQQEWQQNRSQEIRNYELELAEQDIEVILRYVDRLYSKVRSVTLNDMLEYKAIEESERLAKELNADFAAAAIRAESLSGVFSTLLQALMQTHLGWMLAIDANISGGEDDFESILDLRKKLLQIAAQLRYEARRYLVNIKSRQV